MYRKYIGGTQETIQGITVNIPPVGYVWNPITKELEEREVQSRSKKKSEQYWERMTLPHDWDKRSKEEKARQKLDPDYYDPMLESIRQKAWDRRLCGCWFMNNGNPVYVSPLHCFYLDWIYIAADVNGGYPLFYDSDRKFFYFLEYSIEDPRSLGVLLTMKRRGGKTAKSVAFLLDYATRAMNVNAGIQSKTEEDAKNVVWRDGVVRAFKKLPDFFVPVFDKTGGNPPKKQLTFVKTPSRGRNAGDDDNGVELGGTMDWRSSKETAYDGYKLKRYVADEIFKTNGVDIVERHRVVKFSCTDDNGNFIGKMLCTSTVEEIEGKIEDYIEFWNDSDPEDRNEVTGRTRTGLYRFFLPSDEARNRDKYGYCDKTKNRNFILAERESYKDNLTAYYSYIRKEPLTIEEAFRVSKADSIFDTMTLTSRLDELSWQKNLFDVGDFVWLNGERDTAVVWKPNRNGKFKVRLLYEGEQGITHARKVGASHFPSQRNKFIMGIDPYDHDVTVDNRRSDGAGYVFHKYDPSSEFSYSPVVEYIGRPKMARIFYEDMLKCAVYYGSPLLFENNKPGIKTYFTDRGYAGFLVKLPGRNDAGIPGSKQTHQMLAEHLEEYVLEHVNKIFFPALLKDLIDFDIANTTKSDATMAFGYALIGDKQLFIRDKTAIEKTGGIDSLFKRRRIR